MNKYYDQKLTTVTNQNVVAYSPYLLMKYQCHINVQICNSIKAVKYLCYYPLKGEDLIMIKVNGPSHHDEIAHYETRQYISSCSATLYTPESTWPSLPWADLLVVSQSLWRWFRPSNRQCIPILHDRSSQDTTPQACRMVPSALYQYIRDTSYAVS